MPTTGFQKSCQQIKLPSLHKARLRIVLCSLLGIDLWRYRDRINTLMASVSIVKIDVQGPRLQVLAIASGGRVRHRTIYQNICVTCQIT